MTSSDLRDEHLSKVTPYTHSAFPMDLDQPPPPPPHYSTLIFILDHSVIPNVG